MSCAVGSSSVLKQLKSTAASFYSSGWGHWRWTAGCCQIPLDSFHLLMVAVLFSVFAQFRRFFGRVVRVLVGWPSQAAGLASMRAGAYSVFAECARPRHTVTVGYITSVCVCSFIHSFVFLTRLILRAGSRGSAGAFPGRHWAKTTGVQKRQNPAVSVAIRAPKLLAVTVSGK